MSDHDTDPAAEQEGDEIREEKEAQVLRREAVEQELMAEGRSGAGERVEGVEEDDPPA